MEMHLPGINRWQQLQTVKISLPFEIFAALNVINFFSLVRDSISHVISFDRYFTQGAALHGGQARLVITNTKERKTKCKK